MLPDIHVTQEAYHAPKHQQVQTVMKHTLCLTGLPDGKLKQQLYICVSVPLFVV